MKIFTISILIISFFGFKSQAQDVYRTQSGTMIITGISSDTVVQLKTKDLLILLNYENAKFQMKMDKSTFYTGIDSLDKKLALMKYDIIEYNGQLNIESINTNGHPPLDFEMEGELSTNDNIIHGTGHLEHYSSRGTYSCLLTLKFNLKKDDLGLNLEGLNLNDDIEVEIIQMVLNKSEDQ